MLENRPIVAITIGYIIGIIMGLYCKISIVFLYVFIYIVYLILKKPPNKKFKLISFRRYFRYVKIVITKKVFIIILVVSIISNTIILYKNNQYEKIENELDGKELKIQAIVLSSPQDKEYKDVYKIKIENVSATGEISSDTNKISKELKNKKIYLNIKKNFNIDLKYGDKIILNGIFNQPATRTNYKGFDYKEYLKTLQIYGTVEAKQIMKQDAQNKFSILKYSNTIFLKIRELLQNNFENDIANVLMGIILGHTDEIDEDIKTNFSDSNISHVLAVSGMHVGYVILFTTIIFEKLIGRRKRKILTIISLICYVFIIGFSPSAVRAVIMGVLTILAGIVYRKSDVWINLSFSLLIILIDNPFLIKNISLLLSYMGTIGIILWSKTVDSKIKIPESIGIVIGASIAIVPIMSICFNQIPFLGLVISIIIGIIIGPIIIFGLIFIIISGCINLLKFIQIQYLLELVKNILTILVKILLEITEFCSDMPFGKIYVTTPNLIRIFIYYLIVLIIYFLVSIYFSKKNTAFTRRIRNLVSLLKYKCNQNKKRVISSILILVICSFIITIIPQNLRIYFIDVGQGDSTLICTPANNNILIDGGGSEIGDFDVGKNVVLPYLLDRGIKRLDYVIISHFDTDHVRSESYIYLMR